VSGTEIHRPILFVGMPRSGTTLLLESFAARSDLAWFSRPLNRVPGVPAICVVERLGSIHPGLRSTIYRSDQVGSGLRSLRRLERVRLGPTQGERVWAHWAGDGFMSDFLLGVEATEQERERLRRLVWKVMRYEGKSRFVGKLTGPARIGYLSSVFPDAVFVHVIRDGRAVTNSLLRVAGWRGTSRMHHPAWRGGLSERQLELWRESGGSPHALAAIQWRAVIERARQESAGASDRYTEVRYEDFLDDPHGELERLTAFSGLPRAPETHRFLDRRIRLRDMNYRWREDLSLEEIEVVEQLIGDLLSDLGYRPMGSAASTSVGPNSSPVASGPRTGRR
jgi:hypothetical protein